MNQIKKTGKMAILAVAMFIAVQANAQDEVIKLSGYLYVYPEDLGELSYQEAMDMCKNINDASAYGYNNWRLPTRSELKIIINNRTKLYGLSSSSSYMSSEIADFKRDGIHRMYLIIPYMTDAIAVDYYARVRLVRTDR